MPSARLRRCPSPNEVVRIERAAGAVNAAVTPLTNRATISSVPSVAIVPRIDAAISATSPHTSTRFRPRTSAHRPPKSRNPPYPRTNAETIHCSSPSATCSSEPIAGSATCTSERSSVSRNTTPPRTTSSSFSAEVQRASWSRFVGAFSKLSLLTGSLLSGSRRHRSTIWIDHLHLDDIVPLTRYTAVMSATEHPLRKDAERNRQRILEAARELFAERGLGVTLNDVAHHAGVGVGTVYRRFPDKEVLIDTLFQEQLDEWARIYEEGLHDPDPWHAVVSTHERALELWAHNRGLKENLLGSPHASKRATQQRAQLHPLAAKLIERAQAAGEIRADATTQDYGVVLMMVSAVMDAAEDVSPELWRRYLRIALQGLRPEGTPLDPLLVPAVEPEQMERLLIGAWKRR